MKIDYSLSRKTGIYCILNTVNGNFYIGSAAGRGFGNRLSSHLNELRSNKHHSSKLQNAWNKYGENHFIFMVLMICPSIDCISLEQLYLDALKPHVCGYNIYSEATSRLGIKHTQETKDKIRANQLGKLNNRWGIKHTKQTIDKMKIAQLGANNHGFGKKRDMAVRQKISKKLKGIKRSEETKRKMSLSKRGPNSPCFGKKQSKEVVEKRARANYKQILRSDGVKFNSLKEAAKVMNVPYQSISQALRKGCRAANYYWSYIK